METSHPSAQPAPRVPLGGDYWQAEPGAELWGFADLHAHLMAHLAFGGTGFWGGVYDPDHPGETGMAHVIGSCEPIHGGLFDVNPELGHPAGGGWPDFVVWPRFTTLVHQQAYIDWLYRAYQGGLRLVSCLAVNNEVLGIRSDPKLPTDDRSAVVRQVQAAKDMVAWIDRQAGGEGQGWIQIAYSAEEAAAIIRADKLAVVLGMEVDSFGNWRRLEDLATLSENNEDQARAMITAELNWLYGLGIRQITPIHLTDNAFGGTAIYMRFLDAANFFVTGRHYEVEDSWDSGIRYRLDHDGADALDDVERLVVSQGSSLRKPPKMSRRTLFQHLPSIEEVRDTVVEAVTGRGHANVRGLTIYGIILLQEMMRRGMLIDIDHMSQKATDTALDMAEAHDYPVVASHCWFRELTYSAEVEFEPQHVDLYGTGDVHKVAHEAAKSAGQVERIARLGGIVAPILNQGDVPDLDRVLPDQSTKIMHTCAGSSSSWAEAYLYAVAKMGGRGVAMGSDINGAAGLPAPRFGTYAAYGVGHDGHRVGLRRGQIEAQTNGVRYDTPISDYRWHRFDDGGPGAYSEEERDFWQGIAQYKAGFNPWTDRHPSDDFPPMSVTTVDNAVHLLFRQDNIDAITKGFIAANMHAGQERPISFDRWPIEQRAAYLVAKGLPAEAHEGEHLEHEREHLQRIWDRWRAMEGDNPPLKRDKAGVRRDFDINLDGMAHYGLLPDMLQDIRNQGLATEDFVPLFRSAGDYVAVWAKCETRGAALTAANPLDAPDES